VRDYPTTKSLCPHCREQVVIFTLIDPGSTTGDGWEGEVWMHPDPPIRAALNLDGLVPRRLVHRYQQSLDAFRAGLWPFAAQGARATLEGLVKHQIQTGDSDERSLGLLLRELATTDLGRPITDAGSVVRVGGNMGAHYTEVDVDRETAAAVLDLLDAFFEYLVLVPHETERAREILDRKTQQSDSASDS